MTFAAKRPLAAYFLLVTVLAIPFWIAGPILERLGMGMPIALPMSALMFVSPIIAASALAIWQGGATRLKTLLARAFDSDRVANKLWYLPTLLLFPGVLAVTYLVMRSAGFALADAPILPALVPAMFAIFFAAGICEEVGWQGYAYDQMERRWSALGAALMLGIFWSLWHLIPYLQTNPSLAWVGWHSLATVAVRVVTVWLYMNTGRSVFMAALFHASCNVAYFSFPDYSSPYAPFITSVVLVLVSTVVVVVWGARSLSGKAA